MMDSPIEAELMLVSPLKPLMSVSAVFDCKQAKRREQQVSVDECETERVRPYGHEERGYRDLDAG